MTKINVHVISLYKIRQYIIGKGGNVTCNKAAVFGGCVLDARLRTEEVTDWNTETWSPNIS